MKQDDLFEIMSDNQAKFDRLLRGVRDAAIRIVSEMEYPEGCIELLENKTKSETNYPLQILELKRDVASAKVDGQLTANDDGDVIVRDKTGVRVKYICTNIITLVLAKPRSRYSGCVELRISTPLYKAVEPPSAEAVKERWAEKKDDNGKKTGEKALIKYDVLIRLDSGELLPYIERLMRYRLLNYKSKSPTYGCCHLYEECSNAKRCVSKDKMYATGCMYKRNLDAGRIFYGKN